VLRRIVTVTLGLVVVAAGISLGTPRTEATKGARPNILFVLTDDMALSDLASMPHVGKLLEGQGTSFSQAFVSVSLCCPSRTTILRGQYSHNTGVETNSGLNGGSGDRPGAGSRERRSRGSSRGRYRTACLGSTSTAPSGVDEAHIPPGWDEFDSPTRGGNPYREFGYNLNANGHVVHYGFAPSDYGTDVYTRLATRFMTRAGRDRKPFFVYLPVYAPHIPATPAPRDASRFPHAIVPRLPTDRHPRKPGGAICTACPSIETEVDGLYRRRLQSLQAVDDSVARLTATLGAMTVHHIVFVGQRLPPRSGAAGKRTA
jgi:arylsulfatase A-like enzyme